MCTWTTTINPGSAARQRLLRVGQAIAGKAGPDEQVIATGRFGNSHTYSALHNRLAITGISGGKQPYKHKSGRITLFKGEIYNHLDLRTRFPECRSDDPSDGAILPGLLDRFGDEAFSLLEGMFAIASINPATGHVVIANDTAGIKTVYYRFDEIKQILTASTDFRVAFELSGAAAAAQVAPAHVDAYLTGRCVYGTETPLGLRVLAPGSILTYEAGRTPKIRRYHNSAKAPEASSRLNANASAVRRVIERAVEETLMADVPIAVMLSGGLDSSSVAAIAARLRPGIHSYNVNFLGNWPGDEAHFGAMVAAHIGSTHHQVTLDSKDLPGIMSDVVRAVGLNADPITVNSFAIFKHIREDGFKVVLSGDGSDEVFAGYSRFTAAVKNSDPQWAGMYVDSLAAVPAPLRADLYTDDYAALLREQGTCREALCAKVTESISRAGSRLEGLLDFEQSYRLPAYHLQRVDTTSLAHSVEARVPFLQPQVIALAKRIPADQKIDSAGRVKRVLYAAVGDLLPEPVVARPKQPFTLPVAAMLLDDQPLGRFAREVLEGSDLRHGGVFNPDAVERLFTNHNQQPTSDTGLALWSLVVLRLFRHEFIQ